MQQIIQPLIISLIVTLSVVLAYDALVAYPRVVDYTAAGATSPTIIRVNPIDQQENVLENDTQIVTDESVSGSEQVYQIVEDVPSLEPGYVEPENDLERWEDLTPEQQAEIEEKSKPIEE